MFRIHPIKWPKANLLSKLFNRVNWKLVASFWLTIFIPLLYLLNIELAFVKSNTLNLPIIIVILGILIAAFGLILWILSFVNLGKSFGVLPQKQKRVKTGLYKYFNHPMYVGISATMLGLSLANKSLAGLLFFLLILLPILVIRAKVEEKQLT
jgi:protein-S-isoprenylcysteine O-methyltransferase Ste14